jgi:outer membrane protein assembly factor BamB
MSAESARTEPVRQTSPSHDAVSRPLRIWPAVILAAGIVIVNLAVIFFPELMQEGSLVVILLAMMGPALLGLLIVLWWLLFSRASWRERIQGLLAIGVVGLLTFFFADKSMQGFPLVLGALPTGMAAFAGAVILTSRTSSSTRLMVALIALVAGFGYWTLLRFDGMYGTAKLERSWRWEPTAEDRYLASLTGNTTTGTADTSPLATPEWPGFRGPHRNAHVPGIELKTDWTADPPRQIWRKQVGPGWSSFAVAGKWLFTMEQRGENEAVVCLNGDTGEPVWTYEYPSRFWEAMGGVGPRSTPTIAGNELYSLGADGWLHRLDARTGKVIWKSDIRVDSGRQPPSWGFSASPLIVGKHVIVHAGGTGDRGVLAYDVDTAELRWGVASGDHSYSSPHLVTVGVQQFVGMISNAGFTLIEPASGRAVFDYEWQSMGYRTLQPLVFDSESVLIGSGMEGTRRIDLSNSGDGFAAEEVWTSKEMQSDFNDFVIHAGNLYGFDRSIFASVDLQSGERNWKKGRYGNGQVLLLPDANQLLITSETGELVLVRATSEEFEELARLDVFEGKTWNHPVLVGNRLYLRNAEEAACYELPVVESPATIQTPPAN